MLESRAMSLVPNDVFKRPGPHHAFEVDRDMLEQLRAALDPLEELGLAEPLAAVMRRPLEEILDGSVFWDIGYHCTLGEDFGLKTYGPMLRHAGLRIHWGEPFFRQRDDRVDAISPFWAEHQPYLPQRVATAAEVLPSLDPLRNPGPDAWTTLHDEMVDDDVPEEDLPPEERPSALIERWRVEYLAELDRFAAAVAEVASRNGSIITWENEQGWL